MVSRKEARGSLFDTHGVLPLDIDGKRPTLHPLEGPGYGHLRGEAPIVAGRNGVVVSQLAKGGGGITNWSEGAVAGNEVAD